MSIFLLLLISSCAFRLGACVRKRQVLRVAKGFIKSKITDKEEESDELRVVKIAV